MEKTKYVTIESHGAIAALGGILGPITTPFYLDISTIIAIINSGRVVYEVNPSNIADRVLLTRRNVLNTHFGKLTDKKPTSTIVVVEAPKPIKREDPEIESTHIIQETREDGMFADLFIANKYT